MARTRHTKEQIAAAEQRTRDDLAADGYCVDLYVAGEKKGSGCGWRHAHAPWCPRAREGL